MKNNLLNQGPGSREDGTGKTPSSLNPHPSSLISRQPKSIGTVIKQLFGSLNPQLSTLNLHPFKQ